MYASRQADLLGENEALKAEQAFLNARLQDQVEYMQQMIKDKVCKHTWVNNENPSRSGRYSSSLHKENNEHLA